MVIAGACDFSRVRPVWNFERERGQMMFALHILAVNALVWLVLWIIVSLLRLPEPPDHSAKQPAKRETIRLI